MEIQTNVETLHCHRVYFKSVNIVGHPGSQSDIEAGGNDNHAMVMQETEAPSEELPQVQPPQSQSQGPPRGHPQGRPQGHPHGQQHRRQEEQQNYMGLERERTRADAAQQVSIVSL